MGMPRTIAIDGPAGAGKSTIGALVAERLGYLFLDTGAMYRAVALAAIKKGIDPDDSERLAKLARESRITIGPPTVRDGRAYTVLFDGADVTWDIRSAEVGRRCDRRAARRSGRRTGFGTGPGDRDASGARGVISDHAPEWPVERLWLWRLLFPPIRTVVMALVGIRVEGRENLPERGP